MSEDKKPFTVSDRRHFTSEGEVRKLDEDDAESAPPPAAGAAAPPTGPATPPPAAPQAGSAPVAPAAGPSSPLTDDAGPEPGLEPGSRFPSDLLGLLISLGAQASMLLMAGEEGEPPDLDGARSLIELLGALKEKTEGHRTPQEEQLINGLLYELRMAFVQATKAEGR
jgi:hypothetical protein